MTIQEYTQQLEHLRWEIESKKEKIRALESTATNTTQTLTGMPPNPTPSPSRMADAVGKIIDLQNSIKEDETAIEALKAKMSAAIDKIDEPRQRAILLKRFVRNMTIDDIAIEIAYCKRTAQRLLHTAMANLEIILANE